MTARHAATTKPARACRVIGPHTTAHRSPMPAHLTVASREAGEGARGTGRTFAAGLVGAIIGSLVMLVIFAKLNRDADRRDGA
jgi:hypothetical protein